LHSLDVIWGKRLSMKNSPENWNTNTFSSGNYSPIHFHSSQ
jgi:hypothetical protein